MHFTQNVLLNPNNSANRGNFLPCAGAVGRYLEVSDPCRVCFFCLRMEYAL